MSETQFAQSTSSILRAKFEGEGQKQTAQMCRCKSACERIKKLLDTSPVLNRMQTQPFVNPNHGPAAYHPLEGRYGGQGDGSSPLQRGRQITPCETPASMHISHGPSQSGAQQILRPDELALSASPDHAALATCHNPGHTQAQCSSSPPAAAQSPPAALPCSTANPCQPSTAARTGDPVQTCTEVDGGAADVHERARPGVHSGVQAGHLDSSFLEEGARAACVGQRANRSKRRFTVQDVVPPQQMSDEKLRYARIAYREEVMRILHKKREEMAADGYYM